MSESNILDRAREVYAIICQALDEIKTPYTKNENEFSAQLNLTGRNRSVNANICVDYENELVTLVSPLPTKIPKDRYFEGAVAINAVNFIVQDGGFTYNIENGEVAFRLNCSYNSREITKELVVYILTCSFMTVDTLNSKLDKLVKGETELETFVSQFGY